jgi:hypothetical protein
VPLAARVGLRSPAKFSTSKNRRKSVLTQNLLRSNIGGECKAPPANTARGNQPHPANEAKTSAAEEYRETTTKPPASANHASELQEHKFTSPNTGNATTENKYQQQDKLAAKQSQDHQKLQQQQEKEHQQATSKNYNDSQKQQIEKKHTQQTEQLEKKTRHRAKANGAAASASQDRTQNE